MARQRKAAPKETEETELGESFDETPRGAWRRWKLELDAAKKDERYKDWRELGEKIDKRFRDERDDVSAKMKRLNLFPSNVQTQSAITYGKIPQVSVERKFNDAKDDVARVAGIMSERTLNNEIERDDDTFKEAAGYALQDLRLPGVGVMRVRFEMEEELVEAQAAQVGPDGQPIPDTEVPEHTRIVREDAPVDYVHWKDFLWSASSRVWHEVRWVAFHADVSKKQAKKLLGDQAALLKFKSGGSDKKKEKDSTPWGRASLWEIWDKETKSRYFFNEDVKQILTPAGLAAEEVNPDGGVKDPLRLPGFFPCARPMVANATTSSMVPVPDFYLAQDLYYEIDNATTRIDLLVQAVKVAGAYDSTAGALRQLLTAKGNVMIPVENWPAFQEKGGMQGSVAWFPLEQVVGAILSLRDHRRETMDLLFQVTGMSDLMRGEATQAGATAKEQGIKAMFGSVRLQAMQDEFARFCSDTQRLRMHVMANHFRPETIIERSNIKHTPDANLAEAAVELIKSKLSDFRISVKPEAVSLTDFAQQKQESFEMLDALAGFLQRAAPLVEQMPGSLPFLLEMLQEVMARVRGASGFESILDAAIEAAKKPSPQQEQADPKLLAEQAKLQAVQMKAQADIQKEQFKLQADLIKGQAEVQNDAQREENQRQSNVQEFAQRQQISSAHRALAPQTKPGGRP